MIWQADAKFDKWMMGGFLAGTLGLDEKYKHVTPPGIAWR
jgi:hypothetical protein